MLEIIIKVLLYVVFLLKLMEHYEMDFINEKYDILSSSNKVHESVLHHMCLVEKDGHWFLMMVWQVYQVFRVDNHKWVVISTGIGRYYNNFYYFNENS